MANYEIVPKYDTFEVVAEWDDENDREWWAKQILIYMTDENQDCDLRQIGEVLYLIVCSAKFASNPNDEVEPLDIKKALILDTFNTDDIEEYLKGSINNIGKVVVESLFFILSEKFDTSDWQ